MEQEKFKIIQDQGKVVLEPTGDHKHTLIWIHGLGQSSRTHLNIFMEKLSNQMSNFKIVFPQAPRRYVTTMDKEANSWFDIKFRSDKSFLVDFDEAFSSSEVIDSYQRVLKPVIDEEWGLLQKSGDKRKLLIGGFSQGCGMSLNCFYENRDKVSAVIGVAGYLFPFTKVTEAPPESVRIIFGLEDKLRPWEYVKTTYQNRIDPSNIILVEGMGHNITEETVKQLSQFFKGAILAHSSL